MNTRNARFWVFVNDGPVKLTLTDGQTLTHGGFCRHEEGWSSWSTSWEYEHNIVIRVDETDGYDCDGRLSTHTKCGCCVEDLHMGATMDGTTYPAWLTIGSSQRDYTAEAAGY
jgi:hypothetical protein